LLQRSLMLPLHSGIVPYFSTISIIRASAVLEISARPSQETMQAIQQHLGSEDSLIRATAARSVGFLPAAQRYQMLQPLITDPANVRYSYVYAIALYESGHHTSFSPLFDI
jgi:hypothetical protein